MELLRTRLDIRIATVVTLCVAVLLIVNNVVSIISGNQVTDQTKTEVKALLERGALEEMESTAFGFGMKVKAELEVPLNTVRSLAQMYGHSIESQDALFNRETIPLTLESTLERNYSRKWYYVYSEWKKDAINSDAEFRSMPYHTEDGQFIPLAEYKNGKAHARADKSFSIESEWYKCPISTARDCVTNPLVYKIDGTPETMVEITSPVLVKNIAVGMVGASVSATFLQSYIHEMGSQSELIQKGNAIIVSQNNLVVASTQLSSAIGKNFNSLDAIQQQDKQAINTLIGNIKKGHYDVGSQELEGAFITVAKITFGNMESPWFIAVKVSKDVVFSKANIMSKQIELE